MGVQLDTGGDKKVKPNINVTPLVDVVLVLLIIFMLVIPNMQEGVAVKRFEAKNADKDQEDIEPIVVSVAIAEDDPEAAAYYIGDVEYSLDGLVAELAKLREADPNQVLLFRGDTRIPYGQIRSVFHEIQNLGFAYVQLSVGAQKDGWEEEA
ncbi:biopolymer transporter ExbD [Pseudenhygromyxa sp. WMMC2535]|uniref:biopolymer transporter ExbD n=1 Tax=Pseudenhygromyxa sp. WMMC2535 TaxID=2712867 RepID=UPI0015523AF7|nr:biopolymer transporter ExbD [Pseudenhygromyxa sp. WMMC2535]NVB43262.1 biopolymer transporter ExbD [Pseudenhygromyxa sp. WMMC2535]